MNNGCSLALSSKLYLLFQSPSWVSKGPKSCGRERCEEQAPTAGIISSGRLPMALTPSRIQGKLGDPLSAHCPSCRFLSSYSSNLTLCLSKSPLPDDELLHVGTRVLAHLRVPNTCINSCSMHDKDSFPSSHLSMS